jgi:hypothetical protein
MDKKKKMKCGGKASGKKKYAAGGKVARGMGCATKGGKISDKSD